MLRFHKTPAFLPWFFPKVWWQKPNTEKVLYLTFDDGPIPEVTPFVLGQLSLFQAKATFFCVGENIERHPEIARQVVEEGHILGNHTYQHVKAWKTAPKTYLQQVEQCQAALERTTGYTKREKLFRPPHGQLTWSHLRKLQTNYQVVMWSCLSYDFDATLSPQECLRKTIAAIKPGAVVVFHDSLKAQQNLRYVLPRVLQHFSQLGYRFLSL